MAKKGTKVPQTTLDQYNSDDHLGKEIEIKCEGAGVISIDECLNFQGPLKKLSLESYQRLKHSILTLGFSFPISIWKNKNKSFILDAHQRVDTLKRMRDEGYVIPMLPVIFVEAKNEKEAAKKVLAATSQYGEVQVDGLNTFMETFDLSIDDVKDAFTFPEIDIESFELTFYPQEILASQPAPNMPPVKTILRPANTPPPFEPIVRNQDTPTDNAFIESPEWKEMPEFKQQDKTGYRHVIVHFVDEKGVKEFFQRIGQKDTGNTKTVWFPPQDRMDTESKRYGGE